MFIPRPKRRQIRRPWKFLPGQPVLENDTLDLRDAEQAAQSPLAERLFDVPGVSGVFFGSDFITVTKSSGEWQQLKPMILGAIMEHYMSGAPLPQCTAAPRKRRWRGILRRP